MKPHLFNAHAQIVSHMPLTMSLCCLFRRVSQKISSCLYSTDIGLEHITDKIKVPMKTACCYIIVSL